MGAPCNAPLVEEDEHHVAVAGGFSRGARPTKARDPEAGNVLVPRLM
jgi:hypothetical protein